jgi:hypothetical protein
MTSSSLSQTVDLRTAEVMVAMRSRPDPWKVRVKVERKSVWGDMAFPTKAIPTIPVSTSGFKPRIPIHLISPPQKMRKLEAEECLRYYCYKLNCIKVADSCLTLSR